MMADEERSEEQQALDEQRKREQRTPDLDTEDQGQFDEAFGSAIAGEDPPAGDDDGSADADDEAGTDADGDDTDDSQAAADDGGDADADGGDQAGTEGGEQAAQDAGQDGDGGQSGDDETWDSVGREIGALFERDEANITPARVKHHVKTWHGRYKSERDKRIELEKQLEKARAGEQTPSSGDDGSQGSGSASSASSDELRSRFQSEYGEELPQLVEQLVETRAREIAQEQATQAVEPLQQRQQQEDDEAHFNRVAEAHPDAEQLAESDDLWQWIDSQPPEYRDAYQQIAEKGSADAVIRMLGDYKAARGMGGGSTPESESTTQDQSAAGDGGSDQAGSGQGSSRRAPRRPPSRSASGPRRGDADPNDYDAAFDEALRAG